MSCAKAFLFFFNFIYLGVAAALIYVAVWLVQTYGDYTKLTTDMYTLVMAGIIIGVGILILFTAVIGCCGTCRDNKCCLCVFFMFLLSILVLEISVAVLGYVYETKAKDDVRRGLSFAENNYNTFSDFTKAMDALQRNLKCCGNNGPGDWLNTTYYKDHHTLPRSCCSQLNAEQTCTLTSPYHFQKGCFDELLEKFSENLNYIIGIGAGFGLLQILGLVGTCVVMNRSRDSQYLRLQDGRSYESV